MKPFTHKTGLPPAPQLQKAVFGAAHLILLLLALLLGPGSAFAQGTSARLLTTFTNPTPANGENFSTAVAALGSDRVLIGTYSGGAAYLLNTSGTLLTTFSVSDPAAFQFGASLATVGSDRVLIGAFSYGNFPQIGRAYLFSTNGALVTTFTNPSPARVQAFGVSVAAFGSDRVLIGGPADGNVGAPYLGAAYLFRTNGTLLTTCTNPTPAIHGGFGQRVAAVGSDRVLVGAAQAGVAYLFSTNGTLLTTFTNPTPAAGDAFGNSVAAVGSDRVLIGALGAAEVYLFSLNGTLLTTFTNPTASASDYFGDSVAAVGNTRVLISAFGESTDASASGRAYLFSTNGALLNTFTNPSPASDDYFGTSVAAVGTDRVLIAAAYDDPGAQNAGSAYLFDLPYPPLSIAKHAATVSLKWVTPETGLALQQAGTLGASTVWSNTPDSVSINGRTNVVQQTLATTNRFFRLRRP
jgi:FG-GAP repeat